MSFGMCLTRTVELVTKAGCMHRTHDTAYALHGGNRTLCIHLFRVIVQRAVNCVGLSPLVRKLVAPHCMCVSVSTFGKCSHAVSSERRSTFGNGRLGIPYPGFIQGLGIVRGNGQ